MDLVWYKLLCFQQHQGLIVGMPEGIQSNESLSDGGGGGHLFIWNDQTKRVWGGEMAY